MRLWIDTDIGGNPDDAIALLCAAAHPEVELVGISTVDGDIQRRAQDARRLLPDAKVVAGAPAPEDLALVDGLLMIGPWTHGAELALRGQLPARVAGMGGAVRPVFHRGELRVVEHNVSRDPEAARILLAQQESVLVVPLDITATMVCSREEELALLDTRPGLALMVARWRAGAGDVPLCLHDPLALLAFVGEPGIEIQDYAISVSRNGVIRSRGASHDVVVAADRNAIVARVLTLLG